MKHILLIILLGIFLEGAAQGPWASGKGHGYGQVLFNFIPTYSQVYDGGSTTREAERELFDFTAAAYVEIGINRSLTFGTNLPVIHVFSGTPSNPDVTPILPAGNLTNLGNISLLSKYTIWDRIMKVAVIGQVDLPTSVRDEETGLSTGVSATTFQPKLSIGGSGNEWFAYGFFGYGYRTRDHHDFLNFGAEAGLKANDRLTVIININRWHNLNNGDPSLDAQNNIETGLYTSFQEYNAFLLKVFVEDFVAGLGVFGSVGGGMGTSVAASPALSFGLCFKW